MRQENPYFLPLLASAPVSALDYYFFLMGCARSGWKVVLDVQVHNKSKPVTSEPAQLMGGVVG